MTVSACLRAGGADPDQSGVVSVSYTGDDGSSSSTECSTSDACEPIPTAANAASEVPDAPAAPEPAAAGAAAGCRRPPAPAGDPGAVPPDGVPSAA